MIDFIKYVVKKRKIWIIPFFLMFALFGLLLIIAESHFIAPFIYSIV